MPSTRRCGFAKEVVSRSIPTVLQRARRRPWIHANSIRAKASRRRGRHDAAACRGKFGEAHNRKSYKSRRLHGVASPSSTRFDLVKLTSGRREGHFISFAMGKRSRRSRLSAPPYKRMKSPSCRAPDLHHDRFDFATSSTLPTGLFELGVLIVSSDKRQHSRFHVERDSCRLSEST